MKIEKMFLYIIGIILIVLLVQIILLLSKDKKPQTCTIVGPYTPITETIPSTPENIINARDRAVLKDPLYPPVSRGTSENTIMYMQEPRLHAVNTNTVDSFQLVGYLVNREDKMDTWKLIARTIRRGKAEFYIQSSNTQLDVKIPITQDIAKSIDNRGNPFKDIYDLPTSVILDHALFSGTIYDVVKLPLAELGNGYF